MNRLKCGLTFSYVKRAFSSTELRLYLSDVITLLLLALLIFFPMSMASSPGKPIRITQTLVCFQQALVCHFVLLLLFCCWLTKRREGIIIVPLLPYLPWIVHMVLYWIGVRGVFVNSHDTLGCFTPEPWDQFQYSLTALKPTIDMAIWLYTLPFILYIFSRVSTVWKVQRPKLLF